MATPKDKDARKFARVAKQRLEDAELIYGRIQRFAAAEYLGGYAVEFALKALAIIVTSITDRPEPGEGTTEWMKDNFGHSLNRLRIYLSKHGARMPNRVQSDFVFVSTWDPESRYEPGPGDAEQTKRFLAAAASVVNWADGRMI